MDRYLDYYPPTPEVLRKDGDNDTGGGETRHVSPRRLPVERTIDLHGMTVEEARNEMDRFITCARAEGVVKVLVIHGKGSHGESQGIMKLFVQDYLEKNPGVGARGTPSIREGGTGATWAIIRQRSR